MTTTKQKTPNKEDGQLAERREEKTDIVAGPNGLQLNSLHEFWRFATAITKSGLAPKSMDSSEKVMMALIAGDEVGLSPLGSIRSVAVIDGKVSLYGDGLLAVCRRSGLLEWIDEKVEGEGDQRRAVCAAKRKGEPHQRQQVFSWQDAKRANLIDKGVWQKYPDRMLRMRARSWLLRDMFADLLLGMRAAEELLDHGDVDEDAIPLDEFAARGGAEPPAPAPEVHHPEPAVEDEQQSTEHTEDVDTTEGNEPPLIDQCINKWSECAGVEHDEAQAALDRYCQSKYSRRLDQLGLDAHRLLLKAISKVKHENWSE